MNELTIKVTSRNGLQYVSAKDLHNKLCIKTRFDTWFNRMCEYGFTENEDFKRYAQKRATLGGEQITVDYILTIDMAKEICMIQRSEIGKRFRQYFIEVEKKFRERSSLEYKQVRAKSIEIRKAFTDELETHGYQHSYEYINTTNAMKKVLGISNKKKDMSVKELKAVKASEAMASLMLENEYGYHEVNPVCVNASKTVAYALQQKCQMLPA